MTKSVLITGSSTGLGRATAEHLAKQGYTVFASMRGVHGKNEIHASQLRELASRDNLSLYPIELDVLQESSIASAVDKIIKQTGRLDVVLNNAGIMAIGVSEAISLNQYRDMFECNVLGAFRVAQAVLPVMRAQGNGLLLYTSSAGAIFTYPFMGIYGSMKAAMEMMAETIHYDVYSLGIDTVIIQAGMFSTDLGENTQRGERQNIGAQYGTVGQIADGFVGGFAPSMRSGIGGDPALFASAVAQQIALPHGQRPIRIAVGPFSEGLAALNPARAQIQNMIPPSLGMGVLTERSKI